MFIFQTKVVEIPRYETKATYTRIPRAYILFLF